jgi:uncharacterized protein (TIGR02271 family)
MKDQYTTTDVDHMIGADAIDPQGEKIGSIDDVYLDDASGEPEWLAVNTGLFGMKTSFVPLEGASRQGEEVRVAHSKDKVKDAPKVDADGRLSPEEEEELYRHYGRSYDAPRTAPTGTGTDAKAKGKGHDTSGPETDDAMTRSEEELQVGKVDREAGRARLRKYVVTDHVQKTVPVQREEVRVEREPITDGNIGKATDGPAISEEEHEVVLHEEEVVTDTRAVPKERVRLDTETVTEERKVEADVRKEKIDVEGDDKRRRA